MAKEHKRLGDLLLEDKVITPEQLAQAVTEQRRAGQLLGATLMRLGMVTEDALVSCLQRQLGLTLIDLNEIVVDDQALGLVKEEVAKKYGALPIEIEGRSTLVLAMADPLNVGAIEDLRFHTGMFIRPILARPSQITEAIERFYHIDNSMNEIIENIVRESDEISIATLQEADIAGGAEDLMKEAEGRPIVRLANWLLQRAVEQRASDIHIEPQDRELVVRLRVDGLLKELQRLPKWTQGAVTSRIKVLSNLDIAEKRMPQDGRLTVEVDGRRVEMRVSTLPVTNGEKVVIRVLDQKRTVLSIAELGMQEDDLGRLKRFLDRPQGIILVTGPTGSGKSTLLYSSLRYIQHVTRTLVTVEDPVEFQLPGVNQVQVDEKGKKSFPSALRAILRQDPDVIMIGEIRDKETAQIAFRASITGHLVLSTTHTNDAASAVTRLVDLGLEPFMVASALLGVVSMRLVRVLCPKCKEAYETNASNLNRLMPGGRDEGTVVLHRGRGCSYCHDAGYQGRTGIFEVLEVNEAIRRLVVGNSPDSQIRQAAVEAGMRSIGEDGLKKAMAGITTLEEVTRVVYLADQTAKVCAACKSVINSDFDYCPTCGHFVGEHCENCRRRMQPEWDFCPFCGTDSARNAADGENGERRPRRPRLELPAAERKAS